MSLRETRVPPSSCPACGQKADTAGSMAGEAPSPGDLSVCLNCGTVLLFGPDLRTRLPGAEELRSILASDPALAHNLRSHQMVVWRLPRPDAPQRRPH